MNLDWLTSVPEPLKAQCHSLNFTQLITSPTRPNPKCLQKSALIDLVLTNMSFKFVESGVFPDNVSDHCVTAEVRDTRIPKTKPHFVEKHNMKLFEVPAFLHDLYHFNWDKIAFFDNLNWSGIMFTKAS